jgi:hypothetical protein
VYYNPIYPQKEKLRTGAGEGRVRLGCSSCHTNYFLIRVRDTYWIVPNPGRIKSDHAEGEFSPSRGPEVGSGRAIM